ncbi:MAG: hypothetical protein C3F07_20745 [Anaerolineales bacterium]|nr:MAG: hypothetical protein C3F07_20745 [Anaerolineales bacterium]
MEWWESRPPGGPSNRWCGRNPVFRRRHPHGDWCRSCRRSPARPRSRCRPPGSRRSPCLPSARRSVLPDGCTRQNRCRYRRAPLRLAGTRTRSSAFEKPVIRSPSAGCLTRHWL